MAIDANSDAARPYLRRLAEFKHTSDNGKLTWWQLDAGRSTFYGTGLSGHIETTALAALALLASGQDAATARAVLAWLVEQKDASGTWHTTQGTVLALRALTAAMPVKVTAPPAKVYEYYNPDRQDQTKPTLLEVANRV